jgi:hypothetical protein
VLGLAWLGLAWLGLAWLGLAWLGLAVSLYFSFACLLKYFFTVDGIITSQYVFVPGYVRILSFFC